MAWISGASGFLRLRKGSYLLITDKLTLDCTRGTHAGLTSDGTAQLCGPALRYREGGRNQEWDQLWQTGNRYYTARDKAGQKMCLPV